MLHANLPKLSISCAAAPQLRGSASVPGIIQYQATLFPFQSKSPSGGFCVQDFADITSQPTLEAPTDAEEEGQEMANDEALDDDVLTAAAMNTVVQVHQRLCLGFAQSLWYQSPPPANHSKDHITALVSSHQIAAPVMSRFYHLIGWNYGYGLLSSD